jgi:hypothetical protein
MEHAKEKASEEFQRIATLSHHGEHHPAPICHAKGGAHHRTALRVETATTADRL